MRDERVEVMGEWSLIVINRDRKNKLKNYVDYLFSQDDKDMSRREKREKLEKREEDRTEGLEK